MYIKYVQIFKKLAVTYDQMAHPQKRRVVKLMLDGVTGRLLELKHALVELDNSDYQYFDALLADLKLTPAVSPCAKEMGNRLRKCAHLKSLPLFFSSPHPLLSRTLKFPPRPSTAETLSEP